MTCAFEYLIFAPGTWTRNNLLELVLGAGGLHGAVRHHLCEHPPPSDFSSKLGSGWEGYDRDRRRGPPTRSGEHNGVWERECEEDPGACDSMHAPCSRAAPRREGACMGRAVGLRNDRGRGTRGSVCRGLPRSGIPAGVHVPSPLPAERQADKTREAAACSTASPRTDLVAVDVDVASAPARGVRHGAGVAAEDAGDGAGVGGLLLVKAGELGAHAAESAARGATDTGTGLGEAFVQRGGARALRRLPPARRRPCVQRLAPCLHAAPLHTCTPRHARTPPKPTIFSVLRSVSKPRTGWCP